MRSLSFRRGGLPVVTIARLLSFSLLIGTCAAQDNPPASSAAPRAVHPTAELSPDSQSAADAKTPEAALPEIPQPVPSDPLQLLNGAFRSAYDLRRQAHLQGDGPIVLLMGDTLTLVRGSERTAVAVTPPAYHQLKSVCHAALGAYLLLDGAAEPLPDERVAEIEAFRSQVVAVREALPLYDFDAAVLPRQQQVLDRSAAILEQAIRDRACSGEARRQFAREMATPLMANVSDAARLQIDAVHAQMLTWNQELPEGDWSRLRAVVVGSQLPRAGSLGVQYFARLFGVPGEGDRVIYAEGLSEEDKALRLAGTHVLDRELAEDFFADPTRMNRDLLSDGANAYLDQLFGARAISPPPEPP